MLKCSQENGKICQHQLEEDQIICLSIIKHIIWTWQLTQHYSACDLLALKTQNPKNYSISRIELKNSALFQYYEDWPKSKIPKTGQSHRKMTQLFLLEASLTPSLKKITLNRNKWKPCSCTLQSIYRKYGCSSNSQVNLEKIESSVSLYEIQSWWFTTA